MTIRRQMPRFSFGTTVGPSERFLTPYIFETIKLAPEQAVII